MNVHMALDPGPVASIAKKEFMDNLRNRWILALTGVFVVLTLASSYLASGKAGGPAGFGGFKETVVTLMSISVILIPLIAVMLGYATISGEAESGALVVVLAYPVRRVEVVLGKFLGLGMVLVVSILAGFGAAGAVIALSVGAGPWQAYLAFIGLSILMGLLYLSVSMFFSTIASRRAVSLGAGVLIFFWSMVLGTLVFGIYLASGGDITGLAAGTETFPDWVWWVMLLSPMDMNQIASMQVFGIDQVFGFTVTVPGFINLGTLITVQMVWMVIPLCLSAYFFERRDL